MKAELLKRLFRAIASEDPQAIDALMAIVVEEERRKGHDILATQLDNLAKRRDQPPRPAQPNITQYRPPNIAPSQTNPPTPSPPSSANTASTIPSSSQSRVKSSDIT